MATKSVMTLVKSCGKVVCKRLQCNKLHSNKLHSKLKCDRKERPKRNDTKL